jgi:hypothetical protein
MARARNAMVALFPGLFKGRLPHQLRQLGDVRRDPSRFIFAEQLGCRAPPRLILEIDLSVTTKQASNSSAVRGGGKRRATRFRNQVLSAVEIEDMLDVVAVESAAAVILVGDGPGISGLWSSGRSTGGSAHADGAVNDGHDQQLF